jgi:hypothetical protein
VRAHNKGIHAPTAMLDFSGDPRVYRSRDPYGNTRPIVVRPVTNHDHDVAATT